MDKDRQFIVAQLTEAQDDLRESLALLDSAIADCQDERQETAQLLAEVDAE